MVVADVLRKLVVFVVVVHGQTCSCLSNTRANIISVRAGTGSSCCSSSSSSGSCCRGCGDGWLAVLEVGRLAVARGADPAAAHPHPWIL